MKILATSDLHLNDSNPKYKQIDGISDYLVRSYDLIDEMAQRLESYDDQCVFLFGGDWTDKETLSTQVQTYSNKCIRRICDTGKPYLFIGGNHTTSDIQNRFTVLEAARQLVGDGNEFGFVSNFFYSNLRCDGFNLEVHCFPYYNDHDLLLEKIRQANDDLDSDDFNLMVFHFAVKNALLDNGIEAPSGIELRPDDVSNFDLILGGDFHRHQQIFEDAYYIGAPFDLKFGEHYQRSYLEIDIDGPDSYQLNHIDNEHQVNIRKMSVEEFFDETGIGEKTFLHIEGKPTEKQLVLIEEMRDDFYSLTTDFNYAQQDSEDNQDLSVDVIEDIDISDKQYIVDYLKDQDVRKPVRNKAFDILDEVK